MPRDSSSSFPPPPDKNPLTATWYELQRERKERQTLEADFTDFQRKVFDEFRKLERRHRQSSHDLEEVRDELETTQVRNLKEALAKAEANRAKWDKRIWALVSAIVLLIAAAIIREATRPPQREAPAQISK